MVVVAVVAVVVVAQQHREQRKTTGWSCLEWWPRQRTARTHAEARTTWVWCAHTRGHDAHLSGERPAQRASQAPRCPSRGAVRRPRKRWHFMTLKQTCQVAEAPWRSLRSKIR